MCTPGPDVFLGHPAQAGTLHGGHVDVALPAPGGGRGRGDEVVDRPVEDVRGELVQAFPDGDQQLELGAPFGKGRAEPDLGVVRDVLHAVVQHRQFLLDRARQLLRLLGLLARHEPGAVPGARGGRAAEAAEFGRALQPAGEFLAVPDVVQHAALQADRGGRGGLDGRSAPPATASPGRASSPTARGRCAATPRGPSGRAGVRSASCAGCPAAARRTSRCARWPGPAGP